MTNKDYTHLALIVDRSGSMEIIYKDMQGGIKTLLDEQAALPGKILVDVVTFDNKVEFPYSDVKPQQINTTTLINPRGGTALIDAIGKTVTELGEKLAALDEKERPGKVLVVIVTDGEENSSKEWTQPNVKNLIQRQTDEFAWDFIFLGANIDAATVGAGFGFSRGQTYSYAATSAGTRGMTQSVSSYVTQTRSGLKATLNPDDDSQRDLA